MSVTRGSLGLGLGLGLDRAGIQDGSGGSAEPSKALWTEDDNLALVTEAGVYFVTEDD